MAAFKETWLRQATPLLLNLLHLSTALFVNQILRVSYLNLNIQNLNPFQRVVTCSFTVYKISICITFVKPFIHSTTSIS